ncbi:MAG: hypothetical protein ACT4OT_06405 [Acidobacteriota bacterium]
MKRNAVTITACLMFLVLVMVSSVRYPVSASHDENLTASERRDDSLWLSSSGEARSVKPQEDPGFNFPPAGASPQARIEFFENEIKKCNEYLDELSLGINKAEVLFKDVAGKYPFAGYGWSSQIFRFEREVQIVCHRIKLHQENIRDEMANLPTPTPTPSPTSSPSPSANETKSDQSSDAVKNKLVEERNEQIKFIKDYRNDLNELKSGANRVFKGIDDYVKRIMSDGLAPDFEVRTESGDGLTSATFTTREGKLKLSLPEARIAGGTISGTVTAEPAGQNDAERARNLKLLQSLVCEIDGAPVKFSDFSRTPGSDGSHTSNFTTLTPNPPPSAVATLVTLKDRDGVEKAECELPIEPNPSCAPTAPGQFKFPELVQNGRPLEITGPFDGNRDTTEVKLNGQPVRVIAESPNSCVVESPNQNFGPTEITVKEGDVEAKGSCRNLGVRLTAPKTSLLKGETTVLTITVEGLKGIQQNVPLLLQKQGVVSMEGGDTQTVQIRPQDVRADGTFETRRTLTGLQMGAFGVTGTVVNPAQRPIIIPLSENGKVNGFQVKKEGDTFVLNLVNVQDPITGKPVDGEHKLEHQCPTMATIPYISRLFLNKGTGKTKSECLVLITPRIIIQEEN